MLGLITTVSETDRGSAGTQTRASAGTRMGTAALLALIALVLIGYAWMWWSGPYYEIDSRAYMLLAGDLKALHIRALYDRTLGYPVLLVLTGSTEHASRALLAVQLALHGASAWLLGTLLKRYGVSTRVATLFVFALLLPRYTAVAGYVMTECLTEFLVVVTLVLLDRWLSDWRPVWLLGASLVIAACAVTRPTYQLLAPAVVAVLILLRTILAGAELKTRNLVLAATILIGASAAVIGGYSLANDVKFGYFGMTPLLGVDLSTRTVAVLERLPEEDATAREALIQLRNEALVQRGSSHTGVAYGGRAIATLQSELGLTQAEAARYLVKLNLKLIRSAPLSYAQAVMTAAAAFWLPGANKLANGRWLQPLWIGVDVCVFALLALEFLVVGGALVNERVARLIGRTRGFPLESAAVRLYVLSLAIVVYTMAISSTFAHGDVRFREPVDALILFLVVLGGSIWLRWLRPAGADEPPSPARAAATP